MKKQLFILLILAVYSQTIKAQIQQSDTTICAGASITLTVDVPQSNGVTCTDDVFSPNLTYGTVTDIEGNTYKTIIIGIQEWMAENLRTATYNNGDPIPNITSNADWGAIWNNGNPTGQPAWCYYDNDSIYNCPYGKLYNWYAVTDVRDVCPSGWHVPTYAEWTILTDYLGGLNIAGGKMKSTGTQYWLSPNTAATNSSGFAGAPGGFRIDSSFVLIGNHGSWWSSTENDFITSNAWNCYLYYGNGYVSMANNNKALGKSCRCLRD